MNKEEFVNDNLDQLCKDLLAWQVPDGGLPSPLFKELCEMCNNGFYPDQYKAIELISRAAIQRLAGTGIR